MTKPTIEELLEKKIEIDKIIEAEGPALFKGVLEKFFKENPDIEAVRWRGYIPSFNDGAPCTFTVDGPLFKFMDEGVDEDEDDEDFDYDSGVDCDIFNYEDFFEQVFGNNFEATVQRDNPAEILIEDYDCGY